MTIRVDCILYFYRRRRCRRRRRRRVSLLYLISCCYCCLEIDRRLESVLVVCGVVLFCGGVLLIEEYEAEKDQYVWLIGM